MAAVHRHGRQRALTLVPVRPACEVCDGDQAMQVAGLPEGGWLPWICPACAPVLSLPIARLPVRIDRPRGGAA